MEKRSARRAPDEIVPFSAVRWIKPRDTQLGHGGPLWRLAQFARERLVHAPPPEFPEQPGDARLHAADIGVVPEAGLRGRRNARLARIELPGMAIEHQRRRTLAKRAIEAQARNA